MTNKKNHQSYVVVLMGCEIYWLDDNAYSSCLSIANVVVQFSSLNSTWIMVCPTALRVFLSICSIVS